MRIFGFLLAASLVVHCHKKTEKEQYEDLKSGWKYRGYKKTSEHTLPRAVTAVNKGQTGTPITEPAARLYLGYFLAASQKPDFAIAEANLLLEKGGADYAVLAHTILSVAFFEKKWHTLSKAESNLVTAALGQTPGGKDSELTLIASHLLLGTLCIQERKFDFARFHFAAFASLTGLKWTHTLVDAMGDIHEGKLQAGLVKIKGLANDESLPIELRTALKEGIAAVEKETGPVDSRLFWPRIVSKVLWEKLKTASFAGKDKLFRLIDRSAAESSG